MIECLNNLIGVRGLPPYEDPHSGYYINDLQGLTTQQLEDISDDEDHYEVRLAWDDIYARSSRLLETDIKNAIKKYFKRYSYINNGITGQLIDTVAITQSSVYSGQYFDFGYDSKNLSLNLTEFDIYLSSAVTFNLYIYDLNTGKKLDEIAYSGIEGLNTLRINKNYITHKYSRIFVCYDASVVDTIEMTEYNSNGYVSPGYISKTASLLDNNFKGAKTGISVTYNIDCSVSNFVCQRIDSFKDAFLYKLGIEFCNERIYSDRINRYTLMDRDDATLLRGEFIEQYNLLIDAALKDLKIEDDGICFECNKAVNYKVVLP